MSFAMEVKEEVVSHSFNDEQQKAFLCGFIKNNSELWIANQQVKLRMSTISNRIARSLISFSKHFFDGDVQISIIQSRTLKKDKTFQVIMSGDVMKFLRDIHVFDEDNKKMMDPYSEWKEHSDEIRAYVSGMFVATGSVNAPSTSNYHLEIQFEDEDGANAFVNLVKKYGFHFKVLERNSNRFISYVKKSLEVSDFLKFLDASQNVMRFENERISRDMYNNINRIANIDIANQEKTTKTGNIQAQEIKEIKKTDAYDELSEKAKVLGELRIKNPEMSYSELKEEMTKKGYNITKSGVSNLFRTIKKIYENLNH